MNKLVEMQKAIANGNNKVILLFVPILVAIKIKNKLINAFGLME